MSSAPSDNLIPPELVYHVVEHVDNDIPTLLSCALVSHSWARVARRSLFSSIAVRGHRSKHDLPSFLRHLAQFPLAGPCVEHLLLHDGTCGLSELIALISQLPNLHTLTVKHAEIMPFSSMPSEGWSTRELTSLHIDDCTVLCADHDRPWRSLFDFINVFFSVEMLQLNALKTQALPLHGTGSALPPPSLPLACKTQVQDLSLLHLFDSGAALVDNVLQTINMDGVTSLCFSLISCDHVGNLQGMIDAAKELEVFIMAIILGWDRDPPYEISLASCTSLERIVLFIGFSHTTSQEDMRILTHKWDHALALLSSLPRYSRLERVAFYFKITNSGTATPVDLKVQEIEWRKLEYVLAPFEHLQEFNVRFRCPAIYAGSLAYVENELAAIARRRTSKFTWDNNFR